MLKKLTGTTPTRRFATGRDFSVLTRHEPLTALTSVLKKHGGRNAIGRVSVRGQGGQSKRLYRVIDFNRDNFQVPGKVTSIEYDPNRTSFIAQVNFANGDKRYILAPDGLRVGSKVVSSDKAPLQPGNVMPLSAMPIGTVVHNVELQPGAGGKLARSAGSSVTLVAKDGGYAHLKMPSGEVRMVSEKNLASVGVLSNVDWKNMHFGKAGRRRNMGIRPTVRGVAMDPHSHKHGGGEGRSGIGMPRPVNVYGKPAYGVKTRRANKYSDRMIIKRRGAK